MSAREFIQAIGSSIYDFLLTTPGALQRLWNYTGEYLNEFADFILPENLLLRLTILGVLFLGGLSLILLGPILILSTLAYPFVYLGNLLATSPLATLAQAIYLYTLKPLVTFALTYLPVGLVTGLFSGTATLIGGGAGLIFNVIRTVAPYVLPVLTLAAVLVPFAICYLQEKEEKSLSKVKDLDVQPSYPTANLLTVANKPANSINLPLNHNIGLVKERYGAYNYLTRTKIVDLLAQIDQIQQSQAHPNEKFYALLTINKELNSIITKAERYPYNYKLKNPTQLQTHAPPPTPPTSEATHVEPQSSPKLSFSRQLGSYEPGHKVLVKNGRGKKNKPQG